MRSIRKSCTPNFHNRSHRYNAIRGGHAPGYLRDVLVDTLDASLTPWNRAPWWKLMRGGRLEARWLLGQLWNCRDVVPGAVCDALDLPIGRTFAQVVRHLSTELNEHERRPSSRENRASR